MIAYVELHRRNVFARSIVVSAGTGGTGRGMTITQVVWFKKDMRLDDHAALVAAASAGSVVPIIVVEPDYWALDDTSYRQFQHLKGAAEELRRMIGDLGGSLRVFTGDAVEAFTAIREELGPFALHAHMETGNAWTYARDEAVRGWCKRAQVQFHEYQQFGVWRGNEADRDRWAKRWDAMMGEPLLPVPDVDWIEGPNDGWPEAEAVGLTHDGIEWLQPSGRTAALETLHSFLHERGEPYQKAMSSPLEGATACSRLSVHFVTGAISMREVYQATRQRQEDVRALPTGERGDWPKALRSFVGRLHWHCHFMQKLETEPELEQLPMARAYGELRQGRDIADFLDRYERGQTGYPFVDACMRSLHATGWINFRMRAMLMSFASYDLFLPWQESGAVLARLFTDYEPGIHWTQSQMQSGETGINTLRIYSPVKQGYDQDPEGTFIRQWVPELAHLNGKALHEPWTVDDPPQDYPARIVDHTLATAEARNRIWEIRRTPEAKAEAEDVYQRHGSRKRPQVRKDARKAARRTRKSKAKVEVA